MSKTTIALEGAVAAVIVQMPKADGLSSARQRANVDKAFAAILKLIAPRIWEDAEQCCAIAVHRAIMGYDPAKAQFTTFVNWQIRGELQSLRFRLMSDQRPSAKKVDAVTVSLHMMTANANGEEASLEAILEDEGALARTEAAASNYLAEAATASLIDEYIAHQRQTAIEQLRKRPRPKATPRGTPIDHGAVMLRAPRTRGLCPVELEKLEQKLARDREIVERRVFDVSTLDELGTDTGVTKERVRQITKRASRGIAELAGSHPRFAMMADYRPPAPAASRGRSRAGAAAPVAAAAILPPIGQPHNTLSRLVAIEAAGKGAIDARRSDDTEIKNVPDAMLHPAEHPDANVLGSAAHH